jgi:WD40 repeat protein
MMLLVGCSGGGGGAKGESTIRFQLTATEEITDLASVRLTAGSAAKTVTLSSLSTTPMVFDLMIPSSVTGTIDVGALARPASGCTGYGGSAKAYVAGGDVVTVTIVMAPQNICQPSGTGGTGGAAGGGGAGTGGSTTGSAGVGGTTGAGGRGGTTGVAGTSGVAGTTGAGGRGGTTGVAGTSGVAGAGGRGGTTGIAGTGGVGGTGAVAGTSGVAGTGVSGGGGSTVACGTTVGTRPAPVAPPSLATCVDLDHNDPGLTCDAAADVNNPIIYSLAVSPDGQMMATAGWIYSTDDVSLQLWHIQGNRPVVCAGFTSSGLGPAYVAFSPDGKYLAVALRWGHVTLFNLPSLSQAGQTTASVGTLYGVGFSPDSKTVFSLDYDGNTYDGHLYADRLDGTPIASLPMLGVDPDSLAVSPIASSGKVTLAVGGYTGNVGVYSFSGTTFSTTSTLTTAGVASAWGIAFSPDGQLLAAGSDDGYVRFWAAPFTTNATSGTPINFGSSAYTPTGIAFAPGGTFMAVTFGPEVDIWNATTRSFVSRHRTTAIAGLAGAPYGVSVAFSASGGALITGEDECGKVAYCSD